MRNEKNFPSWNIPHLWYMRGHRPYTAVFLYIVARTSGLDYHALYCCVDSTTEQSDEQKSTTYTKWGNDLYIDIIALRY